MTGAKIALEGLALSLKADLAHADEYAKALEAWTVTAPMGDEAYAAATMLRHLYGAIEAIAERAMKAFNGNVPMGKASQVRLIEQASSRVEELRRFGQRLRKRFDDEPAPERLHPLIKDSVMAWPRIRAQLAMFAAFVEACARVAQ